MKVKVKKRGADDGASLPKQTVKSLLDGQPVVMIDIDKLVPDPNNPKKHPQRNLDAIKASVAEFGQVHNIIVQKKTGVIVAGNATVMAMKALGHKKAACVMLDIDDKTRRRLAVILNRTPELGEWDDKHLASILEEAANASKSLPGFEDAEISAILSRVSIKEVPEAFTDTGGIAPMLTADATVELGDDGVPEALEEVPVPEGSVADSGEVESPAADEGDEETLPGVHELKDDVVFPSKEVFQIPPLRPDMLAEVPMDTWTYLGDDETGRQAMGSHKPGSRNVFVWGKVGEEKMAGKWADKIICFYVEDELFYNAWALASQFASILVNRKPYAVVAPNFSAHERFPTAERIWAHYRRQWVARYWQEAGIKVIPNVWIGNQPRSSYRYAFAGIPRNPPCVSFEMQSVSSGAQRGNDLIDKKGKEVFRDNFKAMLDIVRPKSLLVYGWGTAKSRDDLLDGVLPSGIRFIGVPDWTNARSTASHVRKRRKGKDQK